MGLAADERVAGSCSTSGRELHAPPVQLLQERLRSLPFLAKELIAGGTAGGLAKTCVAPLERVKILFQTGRMRGSVGATLINIWQQEGIKGLFKGNGASVLRIVPYSALHFSAYESYRQALAGFFSRHAGVPEAEFHVTPAVDLLAGSAAGATAVLVTYPLDLVRTRLAYDVEGRAAPVPVAAGSGTAGMRIAMATARRSIVGVLAETVRAEGVTGLYRGIGPTLLGILPYAGLKFYVYQSLKAEYRRMFPASSSNTRLPVGTMLGFGACAGLVAQTATYPLDVVRRQMQVQALRDASGSGPARTPIRSTLQGLAVVAREQGWRALYAGLSINYLKVVPSTAIGFTAYDALKQYLDLPQNL
ncbi:hypothetical protein WJX81_006211 [Elliptochloris bilobata]|uniref:Mitochondrial carrier protein n=1 Tax=Elliptochloris bilobata TaxID=381761 RepID=A0AAW1RZH4_9CHLO